MLIGNLISVNLYGSPFSTDFEMKVSNTCLYQNIYDTVYDTVLSSTYVSFK